MLSVFRKRHPPVGSRPGTLVVGSEALPPRMHAMQYDNTTLVEVDCADTTALRALLRPDRVTWLDVQGLGSEPLLRELAEIFSIHALALEDVANTPQRPKIEEYSANQLFITRMIRLAKGDALNVEQVSLFVGPNYILTFQELYGDNLDPVRHRLREAKGPIRDSGADYLTYALLDTIIDGYYPVIEKIGEDLANLEERIMTRQSPKQLDRLNSMKSTLARLDRAILPQREGLTRLIRDGSPFVSENVRVYLRDTFDHCAQLADIVEADRDIANGLLNTYLSLVGMRTNEVMKVLTIMASIFIPLTFLAGIYGMNFDAMPELHQSWGYPVLLALMVACAVGMIVFFRQRGWLGGGADDSEDDEA